MNDKIKVNFKYSSKTQYFSMSKTDTVQNLKDYLETSLDFHLSHFKVMYEKNNINFANPAVTLKEYFNNLKEVELNIIPKAFVEKKHLKKFEDNFNLKTIAEDRVKSDYPPLPERNETNPSKDDRLKNNRNEDNANKKNLPLEERVRNKEEIKIDLFVDKDDRKKDDIYDDFQPKKNEDDYPDLFANYPENKKANTKDDKIENEKKNPFTNKKGEYSSSNNVYNKNPNSYLYNQEEEKRYDVFSSLEPINRNTEEYKRGKTYFCNMDNQNYATYICSKCKKYWCDHCMKYEIHKVNLVQLKYFDNFCLLARDKLKKDMGAEVTGNPHYSTLDNIDLVLNDKIQALDEQFEQMHNTLNKIKESQNKYLVNLYYSQIQKKNYKEIKNNVIRYGNKIRDLENTYREVNYEANIDNINYLNTAKNEISKVFNEFIERYDTFNLIVDKFDRFNANLNNQLESKFSQNNEIKIDIGDPEKISKGLEQINSINKNIENSGIKHPILLKLNYYNKVTCYDHFKNSTFKITDFKEKCNFKLNYQIYCGNICLNLENKLFIVTGQNYNFFYVYDSNYNEIYKLSDLSYNHCRGSLVYIKKINSIMCISGKYNSKCEIYNMDQLSIPNQKPKVTVRKLRPTPNEDNKNKKPISFFSKLAQEEDLAQSGVIDNFSIKWGDLPELNYQRHYSSIYIYNDQSLYIFFGINNSKGPLSSIERINFEDFSQWELVNYQNTYNLDLRIDSAGTIFANSDEVYLVGGCVNEKYTDRILKYNFVNNNIFKTEMIIPNIRDNEYYRFWEESNFQHVTNYNKDFDDEDYTYGMFDAKDKVHLFNVRTYKYTII